MTAAIHKFERISRACATCDHWDSSLRAFGPAKQHVYAIINAKAVCLGQYELAGVKVGALNKCKGWNKMRRLRPMSKGFERLFNKKLLDEKRNIEDRTGVP